MCAVKLLGASQKVAGRGAAHTHRRQTLESLPLHIHPPQVLPSDGLISVSLWDTTDADALKNWLDENLGSDCISQVILLLQH